MKWGPYHNHRWLKEFIDQLAHFLIALGVVIAVFALLATLSQAVAGLFAGFSLGVVREVTEKDGLNWRSVHDVVWWSLGGLVAGWLA